MEEKAIQVEPDAYEKIVRSELAGSLCALGAIQVADSGHPLIEKYVEYMKESATRQFHSFQYICMCLLYAKEFEFKNRPLVIAAILFHKIGYVPGDKKSLRRTCQIALEFYPTEISVGLIRLIKAAQTEISLGHRYGDDRDYVADIVNYFYGTLNYEDFKKAWAQILVEFNGANYSPKKFKAFSRTRFKRMLKIAQTSSIYHAMNFSLRFGIRATENITQCLGEISKKVSV